MDELEISGKRYISSKRIARENRYHPDYVGQLIRGGKVVGTKVGRAWYVDEASFAAYLGKESAQNTSKPAQSFSIGSDEPRENPASASPQLLQEPEQNPVASPQASQRVAAEALPTQIPSKESAYPTAVRVAEGLPIKAAPQVRKQTLTYIADNRPLFPEITKRTNVIEKPRMLAPAMPIAIKKAPAPKAKASHSVKTGLAVVALSSLAALVFSVAFFGSLDINSLVSIQKNKAANVSYVQATTLCFIFKTCQKNQ